MSRVLGYAAAGAFVFCLAASCADSDQLAVHLDTTLNSDRSIDCDLSVRNITGAELDLSLTHTEPQFSVSVIDRSGHDLSPTAGRPAVKDRTQHLVSLHLNPGEVRTYHERVVFPVSGDTPAPLPDGTYSVVARFATVDYVNKQYIPKLYLSNEVRLVVGR